MTKRSFTGYRAKLEGVRDGGRAGSIWKNMIAKGRMEKRASVGNGEAGES